MFDIARNLWVDLTNDVMGTQPSRRMGHGFAVSGSKVYIHAGYGNTENGNSGELLCYSSNLSVKCCTLVSFIPSDI